jgi:UDP-N-acetylmuramoylalanine--D-glutamate ligase
MKIEDLAKHKIGIFGFGREGQAVFSYLQKHGLEATIFDAKTHKQNPMEALLDCTVIFRSPGLPRLHPLILEAENKGTIITSQTKFFFENSPARIVGVTGTKGKGTTCSLIYEILKAEGKSVYLTGNIGKTAPLEFLDSLSSADIVVFELSSFQLQDLTISPHIGICLMVTADHLDHHKNLGEYHIAKSAITGFQTREDIAIYNTDYEPTAQIGKLGNGKKFIVSKISKPKSGAFISGNTISVSGFKVSDITMDFANRKLRGAHNLENIAAAILASLELGIDTQTILHTSNEFSGLEHRLQYIGKFNGVSYYNDSISTVPETTLAAIASFTEPIHLLLGGSDKGLNYDKMVEVINNTPNIASICLLGLVGKELGHKYKFVKPLFGPFTDLAKAVSEIKSHAKDGDVVLLSPATASFDMFENYAERGNQFAKLVKES